MKVPAISAPSAAGKRLPQKVTLSKDFRFFSKSGRLVVQICVVGGLGDALTVPDISALSAASDKRVALCESTSSTTCAPSERVLY